MRGYNVSRRSPLLDQLRALLQAHVEASFPEAIPMAGGAPPVRQLSPEEQARLMGSANPLAAPQYGPPVRRPSGRGPRSTGGFMYRGVFHPWGARAARPPRPPRPALPPPPPPGGGNGTITIRDPFFGNDPYIDNNPLNTMQQTQRFYDTPPPPLITNGNPFEKSGGGYDPVVHQTEDNIYNPQR